MAKIYKISIFISLLAVIFVLASYVRAQGKGYFYEQGKNFFILDNLQINGYLAVESKLTNEGTIGDVLVENNLILNENSVVNFCQDTPSNIDCAAKSIVWHPDNLDIQDPKINEIQTNQILAVNRDIWLEPAPGNSVIAAGQVNLQGCFQNDGSTKSCILPQTCVGGNNDGRVCTDDSNCPPNGIGHCRSGGELRTANFYTDNLSSLWLKAPPHPPKPPSPMIKFTANKIVFNSLDLGTADEQSNVCFLITDPINPCPSPTNLDSSFFTVASNEQATDDPYITHLRGVGDGLTYRYLVTDTRGKWNFGVYPAYISKDTKNSPTRRLCCYLDFSL